MTQLTSTVQHANDTAPTIACDRLNGQCSTHVLDHDALIHRGPEHTASAGEDHNLLSHTLVQWGDDEEPRLEFVGNGHWPELGLTETDALITATKKQLHRMETSREHLAVALERHDREAGILRAQIRSTWPRIVVREKRNMLGPPILCSQQMGCPTTITFDPVKTRPEAIAFWDEVEQQVIASDEPKKCLARLIELVVAEHARMQETA
jgi:hypothetical protein